MDEIVINAARDLAVLEGAAPGEGASYFYLRSESDSFLKVAVPPAIAGRLTLRVQVEEPAEKVPPPDQRKD